MKLAYVTTYASADIRRFSGLGYHIAKALTAQSIALDVIDSLAESHALFFRARQAAYRLAGRRHLRDREPAILRGYAEQVARRLNGAKADAVFSPGTLAVSALECRQPIVFWADATFAGMVDFYPEFSRLSAASLRNGNRAEQDALARCRLALYASDWAAQSAIANYAVDACKVHVVPFGANLDAAPARDEVRAAIRSRPMDVCRLLFIGTDWRRKGGDLAVAVAESLNRRGLTCRLTIVGCTPVAPLPAFAHAIGFLDKAAAGQAAQLRRLLAESHFLLVPSRAECFGHVFCEASAFGLPSLSTRAGGIPTAVRDHENGMTFPLDAGADAYCNYIESLWLHEAQYRDLALRAFHEYQTRLNWETAARTVKELIREHCLHAAG
jgi:glycosyltransferase involved in cell wall biosynthesis